MKLSCFVCKIIIYVCKIIVFVCKIIVFVCKWGLFWPCQSQAPDSPTYLSWLQKLTKAEPRRDGNVQILRLSIEMDVFSTGNSAEKWHFQHEFVINRTIWFIHVAFIGFSLFLQPYAPKVKLKWKKWRRTSLELRLHLRVQEVTSVAPINSI